MRLATLTLLALVSPAAAQHVLYETDFTDVADWTLANGSWGAVWDADALPTGAIQPFVSPPHSLNFNDDQTGLPWGHWIGSAQSPAIDLSVVAGPVHLEFEYAFDHEVDCQWDAFSVHVVDAQDPNVVHFQECLSFTSFAYRVWRHYELQLDPAWGEIRVRFEHDTIDDWNFNEQGSFVDDLVVWSECGATVECEGLPLSNGAPGADLFLDGSASISNGALALRGDGFPLHTFAAAFAGPDTATIPIGIGVRCVGAGTSARLGIAPTRDQGRPVWNLDLGAAPLAQMAVAGQPLYVQTIFRDGTTMNLSDGLRLAICP